MENELKILISSNKSNNYLIKLKIMECDDINKKDENNYSYLQLAIINKLSDDIIILLLEKNIDYNIFDENNNNILHLLIKYFNNNWYKFSDMFKLFKFFNNNNFINHKNKDGNTPLHFAFMYNLHCEYIKLLITKENINYLNNLNKIPLNILIENENENINNLKICVSTKTNTDKFVFNYLNNYDLFFKLFINSVDNYYNILKILIKNNNLNYLKYIINLRYSDIITNGENLNNEKFSFNNKDDNGNTLLHLSILYSSSYKIILNLLNSTFVFYNHQNNDGNTILHLAVKKIYSKENIKIVRILARYCMKNKVNNNGETPFDILKLHHSEKFKYSLNELF